MNNAIHCNKCFERLNTKKGPKLFLFSCKHVLCQKCINQPNVCIFCKTTGKALPINESLPPNVRGIFTSPAAKSKEVSDAESFQLAQKLNFISNYPALLKKYEQTKQDLANLDAEQKEATAQYEAEVTLINRLRAEMEKAQISPETYTLSSSSSLLEMSSNSVHSDVSTPSLQSERSIGDSSGSELLAGSSKSPMMLSQGSAKAAVPAPIKKKPKIRLPVQTSGNRSIFSQNRAEKH